jgi:hypothetical protein
MQGTLSSAKLHRMGRFPLCVVVLAVLISCRSLNPPTPTPPRPPTEAELLKARHIKFKVGAMGRLVGRGADNVDFHGYIAEDSVQVEYFNESYKSKQDANAELENVIRNARKTVWRGTKKGRDNKQSEKRAVLVAGGSRAGGLQSEIAWTIENHVIILKSSSLRHALDLEEQIPLPLPY